MTAIIVSDISGHKSTLPGPTVYNAMTFYRKQNLPGPYTWIVAVAKKYNTMEEMKLRLLIDYYVIIIITIDFEDAEFDMKMMFF